MRALAGVRVLECAGFVAGPYCGRLLAGLGAEVIKVEPPGGDAARFHGPFRGRKVEPERSPLFVHLNTNKLGVTIDLEAPAGRELFRELVETADAVIEDFPPGHLDRLGLGFDALSELNPALVLTSITPFGQDGPYRDYRAHHINLFNATEGGTAARQTDGRPTVGGGYLGEYDAGLAAGLATLAALFTASLTGEGEYVDVAKLEALLALQRVDVLISRNHDRAPDYRQTSRIGGLVPCKDGHVVITVVEDHQWRYLVELMDNPEWAQDPRYSDRAQRPKFAGVIQPRIIEWAQQHTKEEIYRLGQAAKVPVGPVLTIPEVLESPQLAARGFFAEVDHPVAGHHLQPAMGFLMSESPWHCERPAPLLGQHNDEILGTRLGRDPGALADLRRAGVIA